MNIQIFGTKKCSDTKKAERFFKERRIKYQFIDMKSKGMSKGEWDSISKAVGGLNAMIDENSRDKELITLMRYLTDDARVEKAFENQHIIRTPIVRNGKAATIGYQPEVWKNWE